VGELHVRTKYLKPSIYWRFTGMSMTLSNPDVLFGGSATEFGAALKQLLSAPSPEGVSALSFRGTLDDAALPVPHQILDEYKKGIALRQNAPEVFGDPERDRRVRAWLVRLNVIYVERCDGIAKCLDGAVAIPEAEVAVLEWLAVNPLPDLSRPDDIGRLEIERSLIQAAREVLYAEQRKLQDKDIFSGEAYEALCTQAQELSRRFRALGIQLFDARWGV
jgi:hypothetical protein